MKKYLFVLVFLTISIGAIYGINKAIDINNKKEYDKYINIVKNSYNEIYTNISYGDAFESFFILPNWSYFNDNKKNIVHFEGGFMYNQKETAVKIYFYVDESESTAKIEHVFFDGVIQDNLTQNALISSIFESY